MQSSRYGYFRRLVHAAVALIGLGLLGVGVLFYFFGHDGLQAKFGADTTKMLYTYHKSLGLVAFVLMLMVFSMRRRNGVPPYDPPLAVLLRFPSKLVHWLIILAMLVMPILGLLGTVAGGHPVQFFDWSLPNVVAENKALSEQFFHYHSLVGWVLLGLVGIHLAGAYLHGPIAHDKVNSRMSLF
jgi:cytochrome b561